MSRKWFITLIFIGTLIFGFSILIWTMTPLSAAAQCGSNPPPESSCIACHVQQDPVYENGEWHGIHAGKDCCINCHGGNCRAMDKDLAHQGMIANPLSDIYTNCHSCHPDDYQARAEIFAKDLGIKTSSSLTPTPVSTGQIVGKLILILPLPVSSQPSTIPWPLVLGGLTIIVLFLFGIITLITHLRA